MPTEQAIKPLTAHETGNWWFADDGYYIHRNRVFLQGSAANPGDPSVPVSSTMFTGLPAEIRPASTQTCRVVLIVFDPATPGLVPPTTTTATITPGGDFSIPLPMYVNTNPGLTALGNHLGTTHLVYPDPFSYTVVLGNVSWLIGPELGGSYDKATLAPYLSDFENIDAQIGVHGARVHLSGHVRAKRNGARVLCSGLPLQYREGVHSDDGDFTTVRSPTFEIALSVTHGGVLSVANADAPVPQEAPPVWREPIDHGHGFLADSDQSQIAGLNAHPGADRRTAISPWSGPEPGGERMQTPFSPGYAPPLPPGATATSPGVFVESVAALASLYPPPDWVAIRLQVATGVLSALDPDLGHVTFPDSLGVQDDVSCVIVALDGTGAVVGALPAALGLGPTDSGIPPSAGTGNLGGWLAPPGFATLQSSGYDIDPNNQGAMLLWRPDQAPNAFAATLLGGENWQGPLSVGVAIVPFWYTRRHWVMKGDVIDLTGSGWQAPYTPPVRPPIPTTVIPGPGTVGPTRGKRRTGKHGRAPGVFTSSGSGWVTINATYYNDPPPGAGSLAQPGYHFAELGTARRTDGGATGVGWAARALGMSGELPMGFELEIEYNGRTIVADKQDRGYGQGGDGITSDPAYAIDLWDGSGSGWDSATGALGFPGGGQVRIRPH